jgi:glycosyltransferase involved in cell wall biosynthesis
MKVLLITKTLAEFGSLQGKIHEIPKLDVELTVVSPPRWAGKDREFQSVKPDGYELLVRDCWFSGTTSVRVGNHLHFYPGIASVIGRQKWDLVHIDEEPFNLATFHALKESRKHGAIAIFTTWQNLMKNYPLPFRYFEGYVYRNVAGAISGNAEGEELMRRRGFAKLTAHIPQLGVDPSVFRRQDAGSLRKRLELEGSFVVGFVGRLHQEKGVDTLVRAFALLPSESTLVLVGRGPHQMEIENLVDRLGLSKRVRWVPWMDSRDVAEYMNVLDVLVLPSRTRRNWKEQFGRVMVEAMACETCVVGSDSGEIPSVIGDAGFVFREADERELAAHLHRLKEDRLLRETLGRRGRERVLEHFTYAKIAEDTVDFYRRVCSRGK